MGRTPWKISYTHTHTQSAVSCYQSGWKQQTAGLLDYQVARQHGALKSIWKSLQWERPEGREQKGRACWEGLSSEGTQRVTGADVGSKQKTETTD